MRRESRSGACESRRGSVEVTIGERGRRLCDAETNDVAFVGSLRFMDDSFARAKQLIGISAMQACAIESTDNGTRGSSQTSSIGLLMKLQSWWNSVKDGAPKTFSLWDELWSRSSGSRNPREFFIISLIESRVIISRCFDPKRLRNGFFQSK